MSLNFFKTSKTFLREIEQFQDDQAIPQPGVVVMNIESKTFPPRVSLRSKRFCEVWEQRIAARKWSE